MKRYEILVHLGSGFITCLRIHFASFDNDLVEPQKKGVGILEDCGRQVGELQAVFSHGGFIKDFPETEDVRCRSSRAFGRDVSLSTEIRHCPRLALNLRDETNVCEFGRAIYEDDIGRLYVTMNPELLT